MKKDYAVNVKRSDSGDDWKETDMASWTKSYRDAVGTGEEAFEDPEVEEVMVTVWEDGDIEDSPLRMVKENGIIVQYKNGQRLWA